MASDSAAGQDVAGRLGALVAAGERIVFWEDPGAAHAELVRGLAVPGAQVVDVGGRELATKRLVLRERPGDAFVLYRQGPVPRPQDDLLYDVKLAAAPFSCSKESLWAESCGIAPELAGALAGHGAFFASKERVARLRATELPLTTAPELHFAMVAACAGAGGATRREATRELLVRLLGQHARAARTGEERALAAIRAAGLEGALWDAARDCLGYDVAPGETPTLDDLLLRMVVTDMGPLVPDGLGQLGPEASRVLRDLAAGVASAGAPAGAGAYAELVGGVSGEVAGLVPRARRTPEAIGSVDAIPELDDWVLLELADRAGQGALSADEADAVADARGHGRWHGRSAAGYEALRALARLAEGLRAWQAELPLAGTSQALLEAYRERWYRVDAAYRRLVVAWRALPEGPLRERLAPLRATLAARYDEFLEELAVRWQDHLLDTGSYPPAGTYAQTDFYVRELVEASPAPAPGRPVAVVVSDALRYEVGAELAGRLRASSERPLAGRVSVGLDAALCTLPSFTQAGMAALLPPGPLALGADERVEKSGAPTAGLEARRALIRAAVPDALVLQASDVLEHGLPELGGTSLVWLYHDAIDARGDSAATEGEVFDACEQALGQLERLAAALVRAGACRVVVTADHGFIYQDEEPGAHLFADVPGLRAAKGAGGTLGHARRFLVGDALPRDPLLMEYDAGQLSYASGPRVALPRGVCRLRLQGSGARYVHGGATLEECVVPVVTLRRAGRAEAAHATGVELHPAGARVVTGATVAVRLYQTEPVGEGVLPRTVRVGAYAPDDAGPAAGRLVCARECDLELTSVAAEPEGRTTRVTLALTNDVDELARVVVRASGRVGATNQWRPLAELELRVRRGFGNDFDL